MIETASKVTENRLRRMAQRQGYLLVKSRRRDPKALDYGLYVLVDNKAGNRVGRHGGQAAISAFEDGAGMTLNEIEKELTSMNTITMGQAYKVKVGDWPGDELAPWTARSLDGKKVTILETGLAINYDVPAVRVQGGRVRWDRPVQIILTAEQRRELGLEDASDSRYTIFGQVVVTEAYDTRLVGDVIEFPHVDEYVIPTSWLVAS